MPGAKNSKALSAKIAKLGIANPSSPVQIGILALPGVSAP